MADKKLKYNLNEKFIIRRYAQGKKEFSGEIVRAVHVSTLPGFGEVVKSSRNDLSKDNLAKILTKGLDIGGYEKQTAELISGRDFAYWFTHDENAKYHFNERVFDPAVFFREGAFPIVEKRGIGCVLVRDPNEYFAFQDPGNILTTENQILLIKKAREDESKPLEERDFLRWGNEKGSFDEAPTICGYGPMGMFQGIHSFTTKMKNSVYARWLFKDQLNFLIEKLGEVGFVKERKTIYSSQRIGNHGNNTPAILGVSFEHSHWGNKKAVEFITMPYFSDSFYMGVPKAWVTTDFNKGSTTDGELYGLIPERNR